MKKNKITYEAFNSSISLSYNELMCINGGAEKTAHTETSFWEDIGFVFGRTVRCFYEFTHGAVKYQHSLPANLKK